MINIIRPDIFKRYPELVFGFSTKDGGVSEHPYYMNLSYMVGDNETNVKRNRDIFFNALGLNSNEANFQTQVHSCEIRYVEKPGNSGECDSVFTNKKNVFLTVSVADCIPVFLYSPVRKVVAAIHAGWRGTADKITLKTVNMIKDKLKIVPDELVAFIGPGISIDSFEVSEAVAENFNDLVKIKSPKDSDKYFIDLKKDNYLQLKSAGLNQSNIEISDLCTYSEKDLLHSYRRDNGKTGRMYGVIGMR
jgi:YfiH family protein